MTQSCPVPTPAERQMNEIISAADKAMLETVLKAIEDATNQTAGKMAAIKSQENPPPYDYFAFVVYQQMFLRLCGADPETLRGGDATMAAHILDNGRNIVAHYNWAAGNAEDASPNSPPA